MEIKPHIEKEGNIKYLAANQIAANFDGGEYVLMSGNKMKITVSETDSGKITVTIITDPTD